MWNSFLEVQGQSPFKVNSGLSEKETGQLEAAVVISLRRKAEVQLQGKVFPSLQCA